MPAQKPQAADPPQPAETRRPTHLAQVAKTRQLAKTRQPPRKPPPGETPLSGGKPRLDAKPPFGAECRTSVDGSRVTAYCHNPYPETDRLRLHIECERWWDLDSDGEAADAGPATTVRLTGRCWKEVRAAWVTHQNRGS
ncbi:hypothetical protein ACFXAZ_28530 [Streptomyces sp. NPDC059477]|uniref:hypothetical protein n=1 Tax=Streptomyces sp. NPDC059477 TaxID=3346847 RepID=UPI0036812E4D